MFDAVLVYLSYSQFFQSNFLNLRSEIWHANILKEKEEFYKCAFSLIKKPKMYI